MFPVRAQVPRFAMLVAAFALAACGTTGSIGSAPDDIDAAQAIPEQQREPAEQHADFGGPGRAQRRCGNAQEDEGAADRKSVV